MAAHKDLCNLPNLTSPPFKKIELDDNLSTDDLNYCRSRYANNGVIVKIFDIGNYDTSIVESQCKEASIFDKDVTDILLKYSSKATDNQLNYLKRKRDIDNFLIISNENIISDEEAIKKLFGIPHKIPKF
jgi:hypothetical protein